jgi:hypothetical protein
MSRGGDVVVGAEAVVAGAAGAVSRIGATVDVAEVVVGGSAELVAAATGVVAAAGEMVADLEGPVEASVPLLARLVDAVDAPAVDAVALLLHRLPTLLESVDEDVIPLVRELHQVEPDLHALLDIVGQLHSVLTAVPGAKRLLRRAEDHDDDDSDAEASG